jgi:hypothetical protein
MKFSGWFGRGHHSPFQRDNCSRSSIVPLLFFFLMLLLQGRFAPRKAAMPHLTAPEADEVKPLRGTQTGRGFLRGPFAFNLISQ